MRKDLGFMPLVTPTSQIVGTQAVINVLTGERYKTITKETAGVLQGRVRRDTGAGEHGAAGARAGGRCSRSPAGRPTCWSPNSSTRPGNCTGIATEKGIHLAEERRRRRADLRAVPADRSEVPRKPRRPGRLRAGTGREAGGRARCRLGGGRDQRLRRTRQRQALHGGSCRERCTGAGAAGGRAAAPGPGRADGCGQGRAGGQHLQGQRVGGRYGDRG